MTKVYSTDLEKYKALLDYFCMEYEEKFQYDYHCIVINTTENSCSFCFSNGDFVKIVIT